MATITTINKLAMPNFICSNLQANFILEYLCSNHKPTTHIIIDLIKEKDI